MEIRFIGPLGKVTGSCTWLRDDSRGWNFLVDCGMQQGERTAAEWNECNWPFEPAELKFVVLTHAHIDHCGLIPMLYQRGFTGLVYCTKETSAIAKVLLRDAAKFPNAAFTVAEVDAVRWHEPGRASMLGTHHPVAQDLFLRFFRTGHIIGATAVVVCWGAPGNDQRSIAFSGDLGPDVEDAEALPFIRHRMNVGANTFAVVESTYGATVRDAEQREAGQRQARLRQLLDKTIDSKGALIIPAFSLGRTQDVLFDLHWIVAEDPGKYESVGFHLHSPTARRLHTILLTALKRTESNGANGKVRPLWLGKQMFRWFGLDDTKPSHVERILNICAMTFGVEQATTDSQRGGNAIARAWRPILRPVGDQRQVLQTARGKPSVFVISSGSCDGGPAKFWLPELLSSPDTIVALTGYCAPSSVGGQLSALSPVPVPERTRLTGDLEWPDGPSISLADVRAEIAMLSGYSAHADQTGILGWIFRRFNDKDYIAGKTIFLQHGADRERRGLADAIKGRAARDGFDVAVITPDDPTVWLDLETDGRSIARNDQRRRLEDEIAAMQLRLQKMQG